MKKFAAFALALFFIVGLIGCSTQSEYSIRIVIPAGSQAEMVYSEEEISPLDNQLTMKSIDVSDGTGVVLKAVETEIEAISTFFTKGEPMIVYAEKGAWYRIGIAVQNPTDEDIIVVINVENVEVRIE